MTNIHKRSEFIYILNIDFQQWYHNYTMKKINYSASNAGKTDHPQRGIKSGL